MDIGSVVVGDLEFIAPPAWLFHEFSGLILARRDGGVGTLQISTAFRRDLPEGASGEAAEQLARQWAYDPVATFDSLEGGTAPIGVGALVNEHGWIWYSLAPGGLLLAMYRPKGPEGDPVQLEREREEVTTIVRSARWRAG